LFAKGIEVHRDTYLEQQQIEKIVTEVRDVDRIRIKKVHACCPVWPSRVSKDHSGQR
jgi:hypothetical protein